MGSNHEKNCGRKSRETIPLTTDCVESLLESSAPMEVFNLQLDHTTNEDFLGQALHSMQSGHCISDAAGMGRHSQAELEALVTSALRVLTYFHKTYHSLYCRSLLYWCFDISLRRENISFKL